MKTKVLFEHNFILQCVAKISSQIYENYQNKYPLLIPIMEGAAVFTNHLTRYLDYHNLNYNLYTIKV